ncbi:MAG: hypothetical protein HY820_44215 [Acidobacteria bacterium]|nr:hypothetical protein [Acidobacteriota bacterium]
MNEVESAKSGPGRFPCPGCSAPLEFDPAASALVCRYCGTKTQVRREERSAEGVPELSFEEYAGGSGALQPVSEKALQVSCASCGASVQFEPPQVAGVCPFCSAKIVAQAKSADPLIAPQGVLPFGLAKVQASASVGTWLQSRWFAPNALKHVAKPDGLDGVYVPYWSFDARVVSDYAGHRGEYYYVREEVDAIENGRQVRRVQEVRKVRWYPVQGRVETPFDDLLQPATKAIDARKLSNLEPWDLPKLESYEPAYLAGFKAQRYQVELPVAFETAKQQMEPAIYHTIQRDIGGDEQQVNDVRNEYCDVTFRHLLLPVWVGAYRFQGKVFQITVNARTGEVQGERPYSVMKILLFVLFIVLVIALLRSQ